MSKQYDIIVIGAGLGGLTAAFEAARAGKKILLLEQHNLPGGYATSFVRGRFEFEPSLHEMPGIRSENDLTSVTRYLKEDAGLDLDLIEIPEAYRLILTDREVDITMPFGKQNCIDQIEREVPGSSESVSEYLSLCSEIQDTFQYLNINSENLNYRKLVKEHGNFIRTGSKTADEIADVLSVPQKVREILYPYWCYLGVPTDRVSFSIWASLLNSYLSTPAVIPSMRSHELAMAFVRKIEEYGGTIRLNTKVEEILIEQDRLTGIKTSEGEIVKVGTVISNASPTLIFNTMIDRDNVPKEALKNINSRKTGLSLFVVYLGLDADSESLGLNEYSYFIAPHMDTEKLYEAMYDINTDLIMQASICLNAANRNCSPEGTTILALTAGYRAEAWADIDERDYFSIKNKIAEKMIHQFEKATGIDIKTHIEEIEVATPQTFARYTGSYEGIVYGYEPEPWDGIVPRILHVDEEDYIKGLTFCGGFSARCHGYGSSILSGKAAVERVLKKMGTPI